MTTRDEHRRRLLGDALWRKAFDDGFNTPPLSPPAAARVTAILAAARVSTNNGRHASSAA